MEKIVCQKQSKLIDFLREKYKTLSYADAQKLVRTKNAKVNGARVKENVNLVAGDTVEVFVPQQFLETQPVEIVYQDTNICVANKPANIEVCDGDDQTLLKQLCLQTKEQLFAVHRLDRNTTGLVVFAKNKVAKEELDIIFKEHKIEKHYLAQVFGKPPKKSDKLIAYLKKDAKNSVVKIFDEPKPGASKIITNYKVISSKGDITTLDVEIETGKTHQIRAHLAHIGLFVVGDDKYGDKEKNKLAKKHRQVLCANKLIFKVIDGPLKYLYNKTIEI